MDIIGQPGITLPMLIEAGIILPGAVIYGGKNNEFTATITEDGSIRMQSKNNVVKEYSSPSGAARAASNISMNGWTFWKIYDGNSYRELKFYREKLISLRH